MAVFRRVRNQFIYKKGHWDRLIKRNFNPAFRSDVEGAVRQRLRKALADIFNVGTKINFLEHLSLVKSLVSPGDGSDTTGSFVKMHFDFSAYSGGFQMKHAGYQRQAVVHTVIYFFQKKLIAFDCRS